MDPNQQGQPSAPGQKEDYVDKGLDFIEKKRGMNPQTNRNTNEKITDKGREIFEKVTGKHVSDKVSN